MNAIDPKIICSVYRCSQKEGMYLYVSKSDGLNKVPDALKTRLGKVELAMTLLLTPEKKLANAAADKVLQAIAEQGFYLQMPPVEEDEMSEVRNNNSFL